MYFAVVLPCPKRSFTGSTSLPSARLATAPTGGVTRRHHLNEAGFQKWLKAAGIPKQVNSHALRHSVATHLLADGYDIRTVPELLGQKDGSTTMI
jgi:site-specific recombinase XerD